MKVMEKDTQQEIHGSPMLLHTAACTFKPTWVYTHTCPCIHMCTHKTILTNEIQKDKLILKFYIIANLLSK